MVMVSASSSPHSSASSPFDATLPPPTNNNSNEDSIISTRRRQPVIRTPEESSMDRSRKWMMHASIFASLVASGWYLHKGITASINYQKVHQELDEWNSAWAVVKGRNMTYPGISSVGPFLPFFTDNPYYCAILSYQTVQGENATAVSKTNCGEYAEEVVMGEEMEILYNPQDTEEVLEKEIVDGSLSALIGAVAIVFAFAVGFLCCAGLLWKKRNTPIGLERHAHRRRRVIPRPTVLHDDGDVELAPEELRRRKQEREEEVLKHFHFETVASENNNKESLVWKSTTTSEGEEEDSQTTEPSTSTEASSSRMSPPQNGQNAECCICMEKYLQGDHICTPTTNECNHVFHKSCVLEWLQQHDHCPLCRVNLVENGCNSSTF